MCRKSVPKEDQQVLMLSTVDLAVNLARQIYSQLQLCGAMHKWMHTAC